VYLLPLPFLRQQELVDLNTMELVTADAS